MFATSVALDAALDVADSGELVLAVGAENVGCLVVLAADEEFDTAFKDKVDLPHKILRVNNI